jgi:hypothetical protein
VTRPVSAASSTTIAPVPTTTSSDPPSGTGRQGVDAAALAIRAAHAEPRLDQSRVLAARCAETYLTVENVAIGCGIRDAASRRVAVVEVLLVDLATRNTATYVAVPGSGCNDVPAWAAKNIGDMEGDSPC